MAGGSARNHYDLTPLAFVDNNCLLRFLSYQSGQLMLPPSLAAGAPPQPFIDPAFVAAMRAPGQPDPADFVAQIRPQFALSGTFILVLNATDGAVRIPDGGAYRAADLSWRDETTIIVPGLKEWGDDRRDNFGIVPGRVTLANTDYFGLGLYNIPVASDDFGSCGAVIHQVEFNGENPKNIMTCFNAPTVSSTSGATVAKVDSFDVDMLEESYQKMEWDTDAHKSWKLSLGKGKGREITLHSRSTPMTFDIERNDCLFILHVLTDDRIVFAGDPIASAPGIGIGHPDLNFSGGRRK